MVGSMALRIKTRRKELGLTQSELAARMGYTAQYAKSSVSKVECGEDNLTTTMIKKYAEALETTPQWLMGLNLSYDSTTEQKIEDAYGMANEDADLLILFHKLNEQNKKIAVAQIEALLSCQSANE